LRPAPPLKGTSVRAMVLLELGLSKLGSAGLLKLASTGTSGTAAAVLGPPPLDASVALPTPLDASVPPPVPLDTSILGTNPDHPVLMSIWSMASNASSCLWPKMAVVADGVGDCCRDLGTTALSTASVVHSSVVQAGIPGRALELAAASAAIYGVLSKVGFLDEVEKEETDADGVPTVRRWRDITIYPIALSVFAVSDILKLTAVIDSMGLPLAVPLRLFAIGGLLLSFPADAAIAWAKDNWSFRKALFIELAACAVSLFWLTWGTHLLGVSPAAASQAPLLFWACFVHCVLTWSGFSSIIVVTILSSAVTAWASTAGGPTSK